MARMNVNFTFTDFALEKQIGRAWMAAEEVMMGAAPVALELT